MTHVFVALKILSYFFQCMEFIITEEMWTIFILVKTILVPFSTYWHAILLIKGEEEIKNLSKKLKLCRITYCMFYISV